MWTSALLKSNAKVALQDRYWVALATSFIASLLSGGRASGIGTSFFTSDVRGDSSEIGKVKDFFTQNSEIMIPLIIGISTIFIFAMVAGILFSVFVAGPIRTGHNRFYINNRMGSADITLLFSAFKPGYMNVVKVIFFKDLYVFLWSLLFIIPGIIKGLEYFMVEYILAENPHMDAARARELSRLMTDGQKLDIFLLGLSFIGWMLLGIITCGIGLIFLTPYMQATYAELYTALREKAIAEGTVSLDELTGVAPMPASF